MHLLTKKMKQIDMSYYNDPQQERYKQQILVKD